MQEETSTFLILKDFIVLFESVSLKMKTKIQ